MFALVTGASSGMGVHYATQLACDYHYDLLLVSNQAQELHEVATRLAADYHITAIDYCADLSDQNAAEQLFDFTKQQQIEVDVLINNAGILIFRELAQTPMGLINSVLMLGNQWDSPLAVDIGLVDLYSGNCNFVKMGAACTFIKRGNWVECIRSDSLPMGALEMPEYDTATKKLYSGDYIIMVSDGMVEGLSATDKEEAMGRIIMDIDSVNPKEIAETILRESELCSNSQTKDDKTVVVLGLWDKI